MQGVIDKLAAPGHPIWRVARVLAISVALLTMQLLTATTYDLRLNGEAGTLIVVALVHALLEKRRDA